MKKVLCVVTSHTVKGDTGIPTGFWLAELTHPLHAFEEAGFAYDLASIKGGKGPIDPQSFDNPDPINEHYMNDAAFVEKLEHTFKIDDVNIADYDAVFFAGGHGTMWDFRESAGAQRVIRDMYESGKIVSAVCHGPACLVDVKLSNGEYLVNGKHVAAFTNSEEEDNKATDIMPYLLETALKEHGAIHEAGANWTEKVVVDGNLITGQNPMSAAGVGKAVVEALSK